MYRRTVNDFNDRTRIVSWDEDRQGEDIKARVVAEAKAHRCNGTWG